MDEATILPFMSRSLVLFMTGFCLRSLQRRSPKPSSASSVRQRRSVDQTLPLTVKLLVIVGIIGLFAPVLSAPLIEQAKQIFTDFPALTTGY